MVKTFCLMLALALSFASAPAATAQSSSEAKAKQARELFDDGVSLAKAERWAEALWAFRRSRSLVPRPSTSYNIANALYRLDRPVEGLAELDRYDEMPAVRGNELARERGATLRGLLESAVAQIELAITPLDAEVHVDGRRSKVAGGDRVIRLNPGLHSVRVARDGYESTTIEIEAERGSRESHVMALRPVAPAPLSVKLPEPSIAAGPGSLAPIEVQPSKSQVPQDDRKPFVKRPGFWGMIGAIVVVGVGVGLGVGLTRKNDSPKCGTTGTCATTQGLTLGSF
jgi:hypothetical protein